MTSQQFLPSSAFSIIIPMIGMMIMRPVSEKDHHQTQISRSPYLHGKHGQDETQDHKRQNNDNDGDGDDND